MLESSSENYRLSLANKFFDYLHAEIPSINMDFPEYKSIINNHEVGVCVKDYNVQELVNAVRKLQNNPYYENLTANCKKYKNLYSWNSEKEKLIKIYNSITDQY